MFSFLFDQPLGDPSMLSEQADLTCWAEGSDDAGWELPSRPRGTRNSTPWLEAPLNNIGPDLELENVEVSGSMEAGEPVRLSFFVKNSGEQLPTPFNTTIEVVQGDERNLCWTVELRFDGRQHSKIRQAFLHRSGG